MPEQKCRYFNRSFRDNSKINLMQDVLYCACADVFSKGGREIARNACPFQIGNSEQDWFMGITYWECKIGANLLKNKTEDSDDRGVFAAARSYRKSITSRVSH